MNRYPILSSSVNVHAKGIKNFKFADTDNIPHQKLSNAEMVFFIFFQKRNWFYYGNKF